VDKKKLSTNIANAVELHGHLGPFLILGVRMGEIAEKLLKTRPEKKELKVTAKIPLLTPFSCILDGIQATTKCTIGNQKLKIENSQREITVHFKLQNQNRTLKVSVNQKTIEKLKSKISEGASNEELAWEIAQAPEKQLFTIERQ